MESKIDFSYKNSILSDGKISNMRKFQWQYKFCRKLFRMADSKSGYHRIKEKNP